jgi:cyanate permease
MNSTITSPPKSGIFYGWFVMAGLVFVIIPVGGAINGSFGVLLPVITSEIGWSRAEVSLAVTLSTLAFGLPSPLYGILVNKHRIKMDQDLCAQDTE